MRFVALNLALGLYSSGANGLAVGRPRPLNLTSHPGNATLPKLSAKLQGINGELSRADNAYAGAVQTWRNHQDEPRGWPLNFTSDIARYFDTGQGWNCQSVGDDTCNYMVQCGDTNAPAGYIILNCFAIFHLIHDKLYESVSDAAAELSPAAFVNAFAPDGGDERQMIAMIIDAVSMFLTLGIASCFNLGWCESYRRKRHTDCHVGKGVVETIAGVSASEMANSGNSCARRDDLWTLSVRADSESSNAAGQEQGPSSSSGHSGNYNGYNWKGFSQNLSYGIVGNIGAWLKHAVTPADNTLQNMATMDLVLISTVRDFSNGIAGYVREVFSGINDSPQKLLDAIGKGAINDVLVDLDAVKQAMKKVMAGKMVQAAWKIAPSGAGAHPFILKTNEPCGLDGNIIISGGFDEFIPEDDFHKARACYKYDNGEEKTVLVLHGWRKGAGAAKAMAAGWGANVLVGVDQLRTPNDDFGEWSNQMGHPMDINSILQQLQSRDFDISCYGDAPEKYLKNYDRAQSKYWPCNTMDGSGYNMMGTKVVGTSIVDNGCILVDGTSICAVIIGADNKPYDHDRNLIPDDNGNEQECKPLDHRKVVDNLYYYEG
ncbi:hypothetical protein BDV59DRAFT_196696 [Aspergillus ambiguus]|uniref:uncharacterized protein n=1 Tax=Aspergillus ambiguus TaxID=176160 RepID=UPI003CCE3A8C